MLLKRNFLETLSIGCCAGTVFLIFLHSITSISPITGVWFPIYLVFLFLVSLVFSFRFLKWLLSLNRPVKYDLEGLVSRYPFLKYFMGSMLDVYKAGRRKSTQVPYKEYDTNELSVISSVLERKLVSSWYMPYVSQEIGFPFACKQLLDQMIGKVFQISHKIETKDVYIGVCLVFVTHLREYRRALQRHEKSPSSPIEQYYKKSHYMFRDGNKHISPGDHCIKILRLICKDLVPWELWDTPHSEIIVRILAKRLDTFIETTLSNPVWLNDKLVTILLNKENVVPASTTATPNLDISINKMEEVIEPKKTESIETKLPEKSNKVDPEIQTVPIVNSATITIEKNIQVNGNHSSKEVEELTNGVEEAVATSSEPFDLQTSPVLRQRRGRQGRNEVKIYDKIIEGSVKTWETDVDLRCCSLGQDLLASLDGEITLSRLWEQDPEIEVSPNPPRKSPHQFWFGEEDQLDIDLPESPRSPTKKQHSPKSAEVLLKDLASSVSSARSKLEGLQVDHKRISGDEAAGMMEGLLDFGIAGLRKGLRLTGLSDEDKDKSPLQQPHKEHHAHNGSPSGAQSSRNASEGERIEADSDLLQEERMALHVLLKQQRVVSQDSMGLAALESEATAGERGARGEGTGGERGARGEGAEERGGRAPSPQYEEVTDLSATIAKLRSLLNDRSGEVELWEGAEETRGHTARHHHAGVDTATRADEYDMNADRNSSPNQVANNMQRLDKLFRGTVSGVFNSIRGAVGGDEGAGGDQGHAHTWHYVTHHADTGVGGLVSRGVAHARSRSLAVPDAALDSLALETRQQASPPPSQLHTHLDLEEWVLSAGALGGGAAELLAALCGAHVAHVTHVTHRALTLLLHDIVDPIIGQMLEELTCSLRWQTFAQFEQMARQEERRDVPADRRDVPVDSRDVPADVCTQECREMDLEYTCQLIMDRIPGIFQLLGEDSLRQSIKTVTSSLSQQEVSRDVVYRLLDVCAMHFSHAATLRNSSFDS